MKKVVFYSSNCKKREKGSNSYVFPSWTSQWDAVAGQHPDCEFTLVLQMNGRYFLDILDGEPVSIPEKVKLVTLPMDAMLPEFVEAIRKEQPDLAVAMPGPAGGFDWNGIRDAEIAEVLRSSGIETICYPVETAIDCFDKGRTFRFLKAHGFKTPETVYLSHELFRSNKFEKTTYGNIYQEHILQAVKRLGTPVVVKSTNEASSSGVKVLRTQEEILEYLLSDLYPGDLVIQEFLQGEEYGAEVHGNKGNYVISPPYRLFRAGEATVSDPLSSDTLKYGPVLDEDKKIGELREELRRLAELMDFSGIMQIDLFWVKDRWYILEINNRWSGMTTLTTAAEERWPYSIYAEEADPVESRDLNDPAELKYSCQLKLIDVGPEIMKKIAAEPEVRIVFQCEARLEDREKPFFFSDAVISGFSTLKEMVEGFERLQKKYPDVISGKLADALKRETGE